MNEFYVLEPVDGFFGTKWAYADKTDPVNLGNCDRCPVCGGAVSLLQWLPPHQVKLSSAKPEKWGDLLWVGGTNVAVSARFKDAFASEGLRGICSFTPIEIVRYGTKKTGDFPVPPPQYLTIRVEWGGANQDDTASEVSHLSLEMIECSFCRKGGSGWKQERVVIEDGSWNGDDIFRPRGAPVTLMVSQRFKDVFERNGFQNAWFIPGSKYGFDEKHPHLWYINE
jgi:hypothetical protein